MYTVRQIAVFLQNRVGELGRSTKVLADAGINVRWVSVESTGKFGVIKFLVDQSDDALDALKKHGFTIAQIDVIAIEVNDKPGGLYEVSEALSQHGINIENASGFVLKSNELAVLIVEVDDVSKAQQILTDEGLHLITEAELLKL